MKRLAVGLSLAAAALVLATLAPGAFATPSPLSKISPRDKLACDEGSPLCSEVAEPNWSREYSYIGHDEPETVWYSNIPGSGNNMTYQMVLPKEPSAFPTQGSPGAFWSFQEHITFWLGMALCDSQSYPNFTKVCNPDTNANIFDSPNPASPQWMGRHPGTAFEELQFYPPGWVPFQIATSCDPTRWCAALTIDSFSQNAFTGQDLNTTCQDQLVGGEEYINFAFVTRSGVPQAPPDPLNATDATFTPDPTQDLMMKGGDKLRVTLHDTLQGFQVVIHDQSTGQSGTMTASAANGFGQVQFDPTGTSCNILPYSFHPMYSTSNEHTRVPWAAHTDNTSFSDEIGHFDYCNDPPGFVLELFCTTTEGGQDEAPTPADGDDFFCADPTLSFLVPVTGCFLGSNDGFDGTSYVPNAWPGNGNPQTPTPVRFKTPYINGSRFQTYDRVGFEADLPRIEVPNPNNPFLTCQRFADLPGAGTGCTNPPLSDDGVPALFYPIYTTHQSTGWVGTCDWQYGGAGIPGTINTFGGNSASEFGPLLLTTYEQPGNTISHRYNNFRQIISNPCRT
jgi:hypothetical protein